jgi:PKD repeat protein
MGAPSVEISSNRADPVVGEVVTFTASNYGECRDEIITFKVDGVEKQTGVQESTFDHAFTTAGTHTVSVTATTPDTGTCTAGPSTSTATLPVMVDEDVSGTIAVSPDPARPNEPALLSVVGSGGSAPYDYAWDADNDGNFDDGTDRTISWVFPANGTYTVRVRLRDQANPLHEAVVTETITVDDSAPPPPPPPPCTKKLDFALSEFKTDGCFTRVGTSLQQWQTTDQVKLNGISFSDLGQRFVITLPTAGEPGGHVSAPNAAIQFDDFVAYSGPVDWSLPAGGQGESGILHTVTTPSFAKLFGLHVTGSIAIKIGVAADGTHYGVLPMNVELPAVFKPAPDPSSKAITGTAALRVDDAGPHYDGLKIEVTDTWIGRIKVPEACFSYVPAGGEVTPCDPPSLDGEPYLTCESDAATDRWNGNAVLELPVDTHTQYAVFGGLADGQVANLGGFGDNLAPLGVQLAPGVTLNRLGFGLCLSPPPFKARGDVGAEMFDGKLTVNGRFLYTEGEYPRGWSAEVGGNVTLGDTYLGDGSARFNASGDVDFALSTALDLDVVSLSGKASGWVEPQRDAFNVEGSLQGCITGLTCARADGLISSTGVAGCLDAGVLELPEPYGAREGPFGFGSITFSVRTYTVPLKAGFGYRFDTAGVDLLGNSCDFSPYRATRTTTAAPEGGESLNARAAITERIAPSAKAVTLRVHGSDGPPKVVVRGPDGTTITSPKGKKRAKQRKGRYLLAENPTDGTTSVLLVNPAAGEWTVKGIPGAASTPRAIDRADFERPPTLFGQIRRTAGGQEVALGYSVPKGATVRLVERGRGVARTLVESVKGDPCRGAPPLPGGGKLLCSRVKFRPSRGPGGVRRVEAVVTRGGIPLATKTVASFRAPAERLPSRPAAVRTRHVGGDLLATFTRSRGAARYSVTASLEDGRKLGFDLGRKCRGVLIPDVPNGDRATIKVAGVRYDVTAGPSRRIETNRGRAQAGRDFRHPRLVCD